MTIARLIARILLGLMFTVFGLNGFLHFLPMGLPSSETLAGQFLGALAASNYLYVVAGLQVVSGVLLLVNRYVPLALTLLGPVLVNIILFHALMAPEGLVPGIVAVVLWLLVFSGVSQAFAGIFAARVPATNTYGRPA
jgi:putative oxidoreductase